MRARHELRGPLLFVVSTVVIVATLAYGWPASYHTLKNFPKLADFPLSGGFGIFRAAPISAGELKTAPALIYETSHAKRS
jgi:hypothetical protein